MGTHVVLDGHFPTRHAKIKFDTFLNTSEKLGSSGMFVERHGRTNTSKRYHSQMTEMCALAHFCASPFLCHGTLMFTSSQAPVSPTHPSIRLFSRSNVLLA